MCCQMYEFLLPGAMRRMGILYSYAVNVLHYDIDVFQDLFLHSTLARSFEVGNIEVVGSADGQEIANRILDEHSLSGAIRECVPVSETSAEYWAGSMAVRHQQLTLLPYSEIHTWLPMSEFAEISYACQHMSESRAVLHIHGIYCKKRYNDDSLLEFY